MFERAYVLRSFWLDDMTTIDERINAAVAECDDPRAAASVACMTSDGRKLHVLIEQWREHGDTEQDTEGAVDAAPAVRKPRRQRTVENDDARAAEGVEPESITLPLEPTEVVPRDGSGNAA